MQKIALFTDYYELLMAQGMYFEGDPEVEFYSFFRRNIDSSSYSIFSGLSDFLSQLSSFRFSDEDIKYLEGLKLFDKKFLKYLETFKFTGDIYSFPEGELIFPYEPIVRIRGKFCECTLLETFLLNALNFSSAVASKTSRIINAAAGRPIFEFSARRAPYFSAANSATYSAYVAGAVASSNTFACKEYDIPCFGTMAHSWIMGFEDELEAFDRFADIYPNNSCFLIDTYDTLGSGVDSAIEVGKKLRKKGKTFSVRIDSGDLSYLSREVRKKLDDASFPDAKICLSNDLDENVITQLLIDKTPVDSFGVGTKMVSLSSLGFVYKLCSMTRKGGKAEDKMKLSSSREKLTLPGSNNVYRFFDGDRIVADVISPDENFTKEKKILIHHPVKDEKFLLESYSGFKPMLTKIVDKGKIVDKSRIYDIKGARKVCQDSLATLDDSSKRLLNPHIYKVSLSKDLKEKQDSILAKVFG